ncbi:fam-l protein [Plasmodium malariae]|uniref:Fam-l protein n=1 Tax=Plasmodium malariae TaxID=5858 RepID=A0A1D3PA97_PLAMA|nr:fam-l protein [Plasmodium malariae]SCN12003.1 fam-l protein [Plasmodium malariae]
MEQKLNIKLFIKIFTFIFLCRICYFYNYVCTFNKRLDEMHKYGRNVHMRTYRLLAKCKQDKDSSIIGLKQNITNNGNNEKNDICYNEKGTSTKKEQPYESSLMNSKGHKEDLKNKSCIFETKKYSHMEKKIFKELDYVDFLKNSKTLNDKTYKKIIGKKLVFRFSLPVLLLLFFIAVVIAEFSLGFSGKDSLLLKLGLTKDLLESWANNGTISSILDTLKKLEGFWKHGTFWGSGTSCRVCTTTEIASECVLGRLLGHLIYFIPLFLLGITLILGVVYYHKKVKKYKKIKFRKR